MESSSVFYGLCVVVAGRRGFISEDGQRLFG